MGPLSDETVQQVGPSIQCGAHYLIPSCSRRAPVFSPVVSPYNDKKLSVHATGSCQRQRRRREKRGKKRALWNPNSSQSRFQSPRISNSRLEFLSRPTDMTICSLIWRIQIILRCNFRIFLFAFSPSVDFPLSLVFSRLILKKDGFFSVKRW